MSAFQQDAGTRDSRFPGTMTDEMAHEIDAALAVLAVVRPRDGLEQRVMARLAVAPAPAWYRRLVPALSGTQGWMLAAASTVIVAGVIITADLHRNSPIAPQAPVAMRAPRPAQQPVAAAGAIAVSNHPMQSHTVRTRHRGVRPAYRATHDRAPVPRGTAVPTRPRVVSSEP